ncbi:MAG: glycosyl hydrolase family 28-related protein, partial [Psychrobacter sp.]|nr:glycosyl hydrolase family 28-related protein [Psychrobacter sp.]
QGFDESPVSVTTPRVVENSRPKLTIEGEAKVGETLNAKVSDDNGVPEKGVTYQWLADGIVIAGANDASFIVTSAVAGKKIAVQAAYTDNQGFDESPVSVTTPRVVENQSSTIIIVDDAQTGKEVGYLKAKISDNNGVPKEGVEYQWYADGKKIDGSTEASFKLTSEEAGQTITVKASYVDKAGFAETIVSDQDAPIYVPKAPKDLVINVTDAGYGAKGDGSTDDTAAIQKAIDDVSQAGGGTVVIPKGTYMIDAETKLFMRDNVTVKMQDETILQAITNDAGHYSIIYFSQVNNAHLVGGQLIGDLDTHTGKGGEWGMGIRISDSQNIVIENVTIKKLWGDGIYIGGNKGTTEDIILYNIMGDSNRRQGVSIVDGDGIKIINSVFKDTNGTAPGAGIDIEPNDNNRVTNVEILSSQFLNNEGYGIVLAKRKSGVNNDIDHITIEGNYVFGAGRNIEISGATDSQVINNVIETTQNPYPGIRIYESSDNNVIDNNVVITHGSHSEAEIHNMGDNTVTNNFIIGTESSNWLKGNMGNDTLDGRGGQDTLTGNGGADVFLISSPADGSNTVKIKDFSHEQGDKIELSSKVFGKLVDDWFAADGESVGAETRVIQRGDALYYDADGSGSAFTEVQFATIKATLDINDFLIL